MMIEVCDMNRIGDDRLWGKVGQIMIDPWLEEVPIVVV